MRINSSSSLLGDGTQWAQWAAREQGARECSRGRIAGLEDGGGRFSRANFESENAIWSSFKK